MRITFAFALILTLCLCVRNAVASVLVNGDFQTGDFTGWSVGIVPTNANGGRPYYVDPGGDGWVVANTNQTAFAMPPINGYSAFNGFDGGVVNGTSQPIYEADLNFFLRQEFAFSGNVSSAPLSFTFDINGGPYSTYSIRGTAVEPRVFSVFVLDQSLTLLTTIYANTVPVANSHPNNEVPLTQVSLDISSQLNSLGGGSYWLEFHEFIPQYYTGGGGFVLDDVSLGLTTTALPSVPEPLSAIVWSCLVISVAIRRTPKDCRR
jgi:hypothetical protein